MLDRNGLAYVWYLCELLRPKQRLRWIKAILTDSCRTCFWMFSAIWGGLLAYARLLLNRGSASFTVGHHSESHDWQHSGSPQIHEIYDYVGLIDVSVRGSLRDAHYSFKS